MAPRSEVERQLAAIWADVLDVDRVGVHDNFFDLGGDSLLSIQVISRAARSGLWLTPRQLFAYQTVAGLAAVAQRRDETRDEQGFVDEWRALTPASRADAAASGVARNVVRFGRPPLPLMMIIVVKSRSERQIALPAPQAARGASCG